MASILYYEADLVRRENMRQFLEAAGHEVLAVDHTIYLITFGLNHQSIKYDLILVTTDNHTNQGPAPFSVGKDLITTGLKIFFASTQPLKNGYNWINLNQPFEVIIKDIEQAIQWKPEKVLYFDPISENRKFFYEELSRYGFMTLTAGDMGELMLYCTQYKLDLVVITPYLHSRDKEATPYKFGLELLAQGVPVYFLSDKICQPSNRWINAKRPAGVLIDEIAMIIRNPIVN